MSYEFTEDWFTRHTPLLSAMCNKYQPRTILEVGSFEGRSTCYWLEMLADSGSIYCVDTWEGGIEHQGMDFDAIENRFDRNVALALNGRNIPIHKLKSRSVIGLSKLITEDKSGTFDLAYIDGSHLAKDAMTDAVLAFELVRVGGVLIFDDWNSPNPISYEFPKLGIGSFANTFADKIRPIRFATEEGPVDPESQYQLYLEKISE